jgi:hypothetical protein
VREYIALSEIKERGWTDGLVRKLLGEPDRLAANPHYSAAPKMRLYRISKVEAAESHPDYIRRKGHVDAKVAAAKELAEIQRRHANDLHIAKCATVPIRVSGMPIAELREAVMRSNRRIIGNDDPDHIAVSYARHFLISYGESIDAGNPIVLERVYRTIATIWPELAGECSKQIAVLTVSAE